MKAEQVDQALRQKFVTEEERLVFWHDQTGEFSEYLDDGLGGDLASIKVLNLTSTGGLSAKILLEREDTQGQYLIYSTGDPEPANSDWLFDVRLYSAQFHADIASIWLQDLGLTQLSLRDHLKARATFLNSQDRRRKLARLITPTDDQSEIDLKMMAVLVGASVASPFPVLCAVFQSHTKPKNYDLASEPEILTTLKKMDLLEAFWGLVEEQFGYNTEDPSAAGLLRCLFLSELSAQLGKESPSSIKHYQLPPSGTHNAKVFLNHWRDSYATVSSHDAASQALWQENIVNDFIGQLKMDTLRHVFTFWYLEKLVVSSLKNQLLDEAMPVDLSELSAIALERKTGHWLLSAAADQPERLAMSEAYEALIAASEFFALYAEHRNHLTFEEPEQLLISYQANLYKIDQAYRRFCVHAKPSTSQGWDLLKTLTSKVERVYDQGFLQPLGIEWSRLLDGGFLNTWALKELPPQQDFYKRVVQAQLDESSRKRAFVIISDALRYEAADMLLDSLNGRDGMTAEISGQLGVLPSYTGLGMASLLPHRELSYDNKGAVLVDGQSSSGTAARNKILEKVEGMACQAEDLTAMTTELARDFTRDKRVVYIYHNVIDACGDSASTEGGAFEAVDDCLREITDLVRFCFTKFNASKVWVTADHGFLFQNEGPDQTDKSKLSHKPKTALKTHKRYVIGPRLGPTDEAHHGQLGITAGIEDDIEFWVPRGTNRFHFSGGARFIHGGAMPQEVVVPIVTVTQLRGKQAAKAKVEQVSVQVLGSKHKITTPKYRFELIQTEPVSDRRKATTLRAAIYDGENPVSSIETISFESTSDNYEERKQSLKLELVVGTFDKTKPYNLVLRDATTEAEVQRVPVVIDRSFDDDF